MFIRNLANTIQRCLRISSIVSPCLGVSDELCIDVFVPSRDIEILFLRCRCPTCLPYLGACESFQVVVERVRYIYIVRVDSTFS